MLLKKEISDSTSVYFFQGLDHTFEALARKACAESEFHFSLLTLDLGSDSLEMIRFPAIFILSIDGSDAPYKNLFTKLAHSNAEVWLVSNAKQKARAEAFSQGYSQVLSPEASYQELMACFSRQHFFSPCGQLKRALDVLARVVAAELAGPIHGMGFNLKAMEQELESLEPFFNDLHKAWFTTDQALLEKLRKLLSVINLKDSFASLHSALLEHNEGMNRMRAIQSFLHAGSRVTRDAGLQISVADLILNSFHVLKETMGTGIQLDFELDPSAMFRSAGGSVATALLVFFTSLIETIRSTGNGRGRLKVRGSIPRDLYPTLVARIELLTDTGAPIVLDEVVFSANLLGFLGIQGRFDKDKNIACELHFPLDGEGAS